ncbi:hypothetical protein ACFYY3_19100 [Streptomyces sp. NPDC001812]|uniref:hypothetical protein n=1 Tax=Streptomyces sp. NPDC001812 TaxID=3364611 RepID=UPI003681E029
MAVLAVLIPIFMLGVLLMLGRYEELVLTGVREQDPDGLPAPHDRGDADSR